MTYSLLIWVLGAGCWVLGAGCWVLGRSLVNDLTNLDLCSGIGLFARAAREAGFRTVGLAEVNPYCNKILTREFPGVKNFGDIKNAAWAPLRFISLLTAGYPCQPFSSLGKQLGERDPRHLWPSVRRAVEETGPDWFVGENVIGHIDLGLDQVLSDLEDLVLALYLPVRNAVQPEPPLRFFLRFCPTHPARLGMLTMEAS